MSRTCPTIGFEGEKKGVAYSQPLDFIGAGTKSRTRDPLIPRSTGGSENHGWRGIAFFAVGWNYSVLETLCPVYVPLPDVFCTDFVDFITYYLRIIPLFLLEFALFLMGIFRDPVAF